MSQKSASISRARRNSRSASALALARAATVLCAVGSSGEAWFSWICPNCWLILALLGQTSSAARKSVSSFSHSRVRWNVALAIKAAAAANSSTATPALVRLRPSRKGGTGRSPSSRCVAAMSL